jgi:hypothetical protein
MVGLIGNTPVQFTVLNHRISHIASLPFQSLLTDTA